MPVMPWSHVTLTLLNVPDPVPDVCRDLPDIHRFFGALCPRQGDPAYSNSNVS